MVRSPVVPVTLVSTFGGSVPPERGEPSGATVIGAACPRTVMRMPATAILFPGQGSQTPEMRDTVAEQRPDLLERVQVLLGSDPFERVDDGTHFAQPAIFCASLAGWEAIGHPLGDYMAGHSLGELAALVAAE